MSVCMRRGWVRWESLLDERDRLQSLLLEAMSYSSISALVDGVRLSGEYRTISPTIIVGALVVFICHRPSQYWSLDSDYQR